MARVVSWKIVAKNKFSAVANKVKRDVRGLKTKIGDLQKALKDADQTWNDFGDSLTSAGKKMSLVSAGILASATAAVVASGRNEALRTSFEVLAGSAERGRKLVTELYDFAAKTPFEISSLGDATKMLLAMGRGANQVMGDMKMLGEMAAATDRPINEFALVFGQIMSTGFLTGGDAMQLTNKGIGIRQMIAERAGIEVGDVYKLIERRAIPSEYVHQILKDLTSEGGRFYQMMEKRSATMPGLWSNTQDLIYQAAIAMGDLTIETFGLKGALESANEVLEKFKTDTESFGKAHPVLTKMVAIMTMITVAIGPVLMAMGWIVVHAAMLKVALGVLGITLGVLLIKFALIASAILAVIAVIGYLWAYWEGITEFISWSVDLWVEKIKNFASWMTQSFVTGFGLFGSIDTNNTSRSLIDINLNDPGDMIDSIASSGDHSGLNVGMNMVG